LRANLNRKRYESARWVLRRRKCAAEATRQEVCWEPGLCREI